jgi:hypothetical protein
MSPYKTGILLAGICLLPLVARGVTVVAYDDAAAATYNGGIYHAQNGGFGFGAWNSNAFPFGGNPALQAFVSSSSVNGTPNPDIDTGGRAWGNYVQPGGNTFFARRSLLNDLTVGGTYSVDFDTGSCDGQETVSFGLNNQNMCQFYFNASFPNYQFYDVLSNTTIDSGILQTFGGLSLTLTRLSSSTYSFQAIRLTDSLTFTSPGFTYDITAIPGIRTMTVTNADGGNGLGHSMYVNRLQATELPEPSSLLSIAIVGAVALLKRK